MTVYILEDEGNILNHIVALVDTIPYLELVGHSDTVSRAKNEIPALNPELLLADIQLKDGNSFDIFNSIDCKAYIIFITAFDQYAIDALHLGAISYLLKPIDAYSFKEAVEKCYQKAEEYKFTQQQLELSNLGYSGAAKPQKIALKSVKDMIIVEIGNILYCQGNKGYTHFHLQNEKPFIVSKVLKDYEELLPDTIFIRCHQSFLININHIRKYFKEGYFVMADGVKIPISARKKTFVNEIINHL